VYERIRFPRVGTSLRGHSENRSASFAQYPAFSGTIFRTVFLDACISIRYGPGTRPPTRASARPLASDIRDDHYLLAGRQREDTEVIATNLITCAGTKSDAVLFDCRSLLGQETPLNLARGVQLRASRNLSRRSKGKALKHPHDVRPKRVLSPLTSVAGRVDSKRRIN
jgi:hypothetical protein